MISCSDLQPQTSQIGNSVITLAEDYEPWCVSLFCRGKVVCDEIFDVHRLRRYLSTYSQTNEYNIA